MHADVLCAFMQACVLECEVHSCMHVSSNAAGNAARAFVHAASAFRHSCLLEFMHVELLRARSCKHACWNSCMFELCKRVRTVMHVGIHACLNAASVFRHSCMLEFMHV